MKLLCKLGIWHNYEKVSCNGITKYFECRKCGKRKYKQRIAGHQPVDKKWLDGADREPLQTTYKPPMGNSFVCPTPDKDPREEES